MGKRKRMRTKEKTEQKAQRKRISLQRLKRERKLKAA